MDFFSKSELVRDYPLLTFMMCSNLISLATYSRTIAAALNGSSRAAWILNAFNVVTIIGAPCLSHWSDLFGRKYIIVGALPVGVIGGIIGCRATSVSQLLMFLL